MLISSIDLIDQITLPDWKHEGALRFKAEHQSAQESMPEDDQDDAPRSRVAATEMGKLAASIGHELNNPLGYACSSVEYCVTTLERWHGAGERDEEINLLALRRDLAQLLEAMQDAQRGLACASRVVKELQEFTPLRDMERAPVNLNFALSSVVQRAQHSQQVAILYTMCPEPSFVQGDARVLTQALEHILENACQAASARDAAPVRVECLLRGARAEVRVTDQGAGMDSEQLARARDPFYTSHGASGHLGLGLTLAHQIAVAHGGTLSIKSAPGIGTQVTLELPSMAHHAAPEASALPAHEASALSETIEDTPPPPPLHYVALCEGDTGLSEELAAVVDVDRYELRCLPTLDEARAWIATHPQARGALIYAGDQQVDELASLYERLDIEERGRFACVTRGVTHHTWRRYVTQHAICELRQPFRVAYLRRQLGDLFG